MRLSPSLCTPIQEAIMPVFNKVRGHLECGHESLQQLGSTILCCAATALQSALAAARASTGATCLLIAFVLGVL
eukprot:963659-Pelagomonas_calceolata.AAC.2